ncbi:signal peptidase I [Fundidesulfovibrio butyratiphilus]
MRNRLRSILADFCTSAVWAVGLAFFIKAFLFQTFFIPSESMASTLVPGDRLIGWTSAYGARVPFTDITLTRGDDPKRGDIVVFEFPPDPSSDMLIKRVIGLPGERLEMRAGKMFVAGRPLDEPYVTRDPSVGDSICDFGPVTVPRDQYFVMGDNRDHSYDSRYWGFVPRRMIRAKAAFIYWSGENLAHWRWGRMGTVLD